jgi:RimJ/RimL family protein N-acetyltransferase
VIDDPIQFFADRDFAWGNVQAIKYDPTNPAFPAPYLYHLYERTRLSGRSKLGSLPMLFCGMTNLALDPICSYLSQRPICVVGEWRRHTFLTAPDPDSVDTPYFHELGYCFPAVNVIQTASTFDNPQNSVFAGYTLFGDVWGTPQQTICMYLGLAWLFHTFHLVAIHGTRYTDNHLTARFTHKFGFKDVGTIQHYMLKETGQPLVGAVVSTLTRSDFVDLTRRLLSNVGGETTDGRGLEGRGAE